MGGHVRRISKKSSWVGVPNERNSQPLLMSQVMVGAATNNRGRAPTGWLIVSNDVRALHWVLENEKMAFSSGLAKASFANEVRGHTNSLCESECV